MVKLLYQIWSNMKMPLNVFSLYGILKLILGEERLSPSEELRVRQPGLGGNWCELNETVLKPWLKLQSHVLSHN